MRRSAAADGAYSITDLSFGTYFVRAQVVAGWKQTAGPAFYTVVRTSTCDASTGNDFGFFQLVTINGQAFRDDNRNGLQDAGEGVLSSRAIVLTRAEPVALLEADFGNGAGGTSLDGFTATDAWHATTACGGSDPGHSTPEIAYFGQDATCNFELTSLSGSLTSPAVALPSGVSASLQFNYRLEGEGSPVYDVASVQVSVDGGAFTTIATNADGTLPGTTSWSRFALDLSAYAGHTVVVRFYFDPYDDLANWFLGFQVDDVRIAREFKVQVTTDAAGLYSFTGVEPGRYDVAAAEQTGWIQTAAPVVVGAYSSGAIVSDVKFGSAPRREIHGRAFQDLDQDGTDEGGLDSGLAGWLVFLDANLNGVWDTGEPSARTSVARWELRRTSDGLVLDWEEIQSRQTKLLPPAGFGSSAAPATPVMLQNADMATVTEPTAAWSHPQTCSSNPAGCSTMTYRLDRFGNITESTEPLASGITRSTKLQRDSDGRLTRLTEPDPDGPGPLPPSVTTFWRDTRGNVTQVSFPDSSTVRYEYHPTVSWVTKITDPLGAEHQFTYDTSGHVTEWKDALRNRTQFTYNARGNLATVRDALSRVTTYTYDALDRLVTVAQPDSTTLVFSYDTADNLKTARDERGKTTTYNYDALDRLTRITDPLSRATTFTIDTMGNTTRVTDPTGAFTTATYDALNRVVTLTDQLNRATTTTYNGARLIASISDPLGHTVSYEYDIAARLVHITGPDPDGAGPLLSSDTTFVYDRADRLTQATELVDGSTAAVTSFVYDVMHRVLSRSDALGLVHSYQYDLAGQLTQRTEPDPDGGGPLLAPVTRYEYDAMGRLTRILYPLSVTHEFRYDDVGNLTRFTNGEGDRTDYTYDAMNRRVSRRDHLDGVFSWTYTLGLLSAQTDELNHTTQFGYDDAGQLISTTSPLNKLTTIGYDLAGRVTSVTDPLLRTWRWTYDAAGQLTQWTEPDPDGAGPLATPVTSVSYDAAGRLTAVTDPLGHATSYVYDNADQLTQVVEPDPDGAGPLASSITQFRYDRGGRRSSIIDPEGKPTDFTYNLLGWLVTVRQPDPDGGGPLARPLTSYEYYNSGLMLRVIDPNNNSTSYQYDDLHRLLRMTQTNGVSSVVTQFAYDRESRVTRVTDPYGNQTDFNYDRLGRTTRETDPKGEPIRYDYDAASNLTRITDREGRKREFVYDAADRLTTERWKTGAATVRTISYGYNDADELVSASDPDSSYAFTYYATGWLKTVNNAGTPLVPQVLLTYSYDAAGRRTRLDNTSGVTGLPAAVTAGFVKYDYDNADRVTRIQDGIVSAGSDAVRKQVDFTYNQRDQFSTIKRYLGAGTTLVTQASFTYDDIGRLTDLHHTRPAGTTLDRFQLTYDAGSRITSVVTTPTGAALTPFTTNFSYDRTDQLTGATSPVRNESYNYDLSGNRTASSSGSDNRTYTYTGSQHANRVYRDGQYQYEYDKEGNLIRRIKKNGDRYNGETLFFTWDHRNRLTRVQRRATSSASSTLLMSVDYVYDLFDRRIAKTVDPDGAGAAAAYRETYVYDGPHILLSFLDPDASGPQPSTLNSRLLYGPAIDMLLAEEQFPSTFPAQPSTILWPLFDWLGSTRDLVHYDTATGQTVVDKHIDYDSFGTASRVTNGSGVPSTLDAQPSTRFLYTGREFDKETGNYYFRARYYDAAIGRWLSEDPLGFMGGDSNLYRYVGNAASNANDPSGLESLPVGMRPQDTDEFQKPIIDKRREDEKKRLEEKKRREKLQTQIDEIERKEWDLRSKIVDNILKPTYRWQLGLQLDDLIARRRALEEELEFGPRRKRRAFPELVAESEEAVRRRLEILQMMQQEDRDEYGRMCRQAGMDIVCAIAGQKGRVIGRPRPGNKPCFVQGTLVAVTSDGESSVAQTGGQPERMDQENPAWDYDLLSFACAVVVVTTGGWYLLRLRAERARREFVNALDHLLSDHLCNPLMPMPRGHWQERGFSDSQRVTTMIRIGTQGVRRP